MLGFISALSAAVATMTLLMAVLLANVLASAMEVEKNKDKALLTGIKEKNTDESEEFNNKNIMAKSLTFSREVLQVLDNKKVKSVDIYCTYGNNISFDSAMTYTVYNTILIKRNTPNASIKALKPVEDNVGVNACFLKGEEYESK
ncbi:hypothetical protein [Providencia rettgeri]|uniref:hypothetical protein n=1 Tax=Providencia rettgeri TaxID=587 RepID=UPI00352441E2